MQIFTGNKSMKTEEKLYYMKNKISRQKQH